MNVSRQNNAKLIGSFKKLNSSSRLKIWSYENFLRVIKKFNRDGVWLSNSKSCCLTLILTQQPSPFCYGGIPGMHGKPGSPGVAGRDGRDGREGAKGDQGSPGKTGPQGPPGPQGTSGVNGKDGAKGATGAQGPPGQKGQRGESGTSGFPGTPGAMSYKNWKECVWKDVNDGRDNGLIKVNFLKDHRCIHSNLLDCPT